MSAVEVKIPYMSNNYKSVSNSEAYLKYGNNEYNLFDSNRILNVEYEICDNEIECNKKYLIVVIIPYITTMKSSHLNAYSIYYDVFQKIYEYDDSRFMLQLNPGKIIYFRIEIEENVDNFYIGSKKFDFDVNNFYNDWIPLYVKDILYLSMDYSEFYQI